MRVAYRIPVKEVKLLYLNSSGFEINLLKEK